MELEVRISRGEGGNYRAWVPLLPGCFALGETQDKAIEGLQREVGWYVGGMNAVCPVELVATPAAEPVCESL